MGAALDDDAPGSSAFDRRWPLGAVALAVLFGLVDLAREVDPVSYLNDSSIHAQMARSVTAQLRAGHFPLDGWWPYLGLGSPQFLHYQGLGSILTGIVGLATGPDTAFRWSLYLLVATWPVSIYLGARLFGLSRAVGAGAALVSPLITSRLGIGYEQTTYLWIGYGLTTQLYAMWTLPLAWGARWRAVHTGRRLWLAATLSALTVALHFMTGYLALAVLVIWPLCARVDLARRVARAAAVAAGSVAAAAWVIVPVLAQARFASVNEFLAHTPIADSYGARTVLAWLVDGSLLDWHRFPVVSVLAAFGAVVCVLAARSDARARALLGATALSLVLFFGRPTLGPLLHLLPGNTDLFLRRFLMGVQLGAILLAGVGAVALGGVALRLVRLVAVAFAPVDLTGFPTPAATSASPATPTTPGSTSASPSDPPAARPRHVAALAPASAAGRVVAPVAGVVALVAVLFPAWHAVAQREHQNTADIVVQRSADATAGRELAAVVATAKRLGPGRFYAGLPDNWGATFTVGYVPVFKYLERLDVDEVGYTLRTASLMTDPEAYFDEANAGDFALFGVRYLVLPPDHTPPVPARFVVRDGPYELWVLASVSYVRVVDTSGSYAADRTNVGRRSVAFLDGASPGLGIYPTVAFAGAPAAAPTRPVGVALTGPAGSVTSERADLAEGRLSAVVDARRRAVVVLSASYDPGWTATLDGHAVATEMVAPALVGVVVGPGVHRVTFTYAAFGAYPELFALGAAALLVLGGAPALGGRLAARRRRAQAVGVVAGASPGGPPAI